ncbi:response regulator transcription factor [candidate division KSB1 bacterium]|nr:response regulator transcription factor [candidate division KSB1 bacterium]
MIKIAIIEDDDDFRESLAILINKRADFRCISAYPDCESALQNIERDAPDVILMDIGLPGMSGIEGTQKIKERLPESDILVLTIHEEDGTVFDALCAGATGYLTKDIPPTRILEAIAEVYWGGAPMSSNIARMIVHSFQMVLHSPLTKRENDILAQMCKGMSYKSIADNLFISQETVRSHIKHIYQKLHVHSKSEAVAKAFRERLVRV